MRLKGQLIEAIQSRGGAMSLDDLAGYEAEIVDPISYTYGVDKHTIWECPPNGSVAGILASCASANAAGKVWRL